MNERNRAGNSLNTLQDLQSVCKVRSVIIRIIFIFILFILSLQGRPQNSPQDQVPLITQHCVLHNRPSRPTEPQSAPPYWGRGLEHERVCQPPPHGELLLHHNTSYITLTRHIISYHIVKKERIIPWRPFCPSAYIILYCIIIY